MYVDSGSTDNSVEFAKRQGIHTIELDSSVPYTAARARNAGVEALIHRNEIDYVQFIDGDCEVLESWISHGIAILESHPDVAVVCGFLQERNPERSVYSKLCQLEWDGPTGEIDACGGIAMMRFLAFEEAGKFRDDLIAGEEGELCLRFRRLGWKILRTNQPMATHDAAITKFTQWWQRCTRTGYAYAEGWYLNRKSGGYKHRECMSALFWGILMPALALLALILEPSWSWTFLLAYAVQITRLVGKSRYSRADSLTWAVFIMIAKVPEAIGILRFVWRLLKNDAPNLIEYR